MFKISGLGGFKNAYNKNIKNKNINRLTNVNNLIES